ncbi:MAG: Thiol-disulfide oxidoreductase ResA [Polaribacter sp. SA4-10]|nr:MAG: Thiol-disulfide oxidoreductase ResA [Polaribacter sp. SA4-10]
MKKIIFLSFLLVSTTCFSQKIIPNINLTTLKGKSVSLESQLSKDKITVLAFWATWCVPCINELDAINDVYEDWQEETSVDIIAIATDDSRTQKRIKPMVNGKGWEYQILLDKNQELKRALNITLIPHVIVLKGNEILYRHTGYAPGAEDELYDIIKKHSK